MKNSCIIIQHLTIMQILKKTTGGGGKKSKCETGNWSICKKKAIAY